MYPHNQAHIFHKNERTDRQTDRQADTQTGGRLERRARHKRVSRSWSQSAANCWVISRLAMANEKATMNVPAGERVYYHCSSSGTHNETTKKRTYRDRGRVNTQLDSNVP